MSEAMKSCEAQATPTGCDQAAYAPDPYQLIKDRIDYHNKASNELWALYRALLREMTRSASDALAQLLHDARPRY